MVLSVVKRAKYEQHCDRKLGEHGWIQRGVMGSADPLASTCLLYFKPKIRYYAV